MANILGYYYIPSGLPKEVCDIIKKKYLFSEYHQSTVNENGNSVNEKIRKSKHLWLNTDSWIAGMMSHFIHHANEEYFKFDLTKWSDKIQYTIYDGTGTHYNWHYDTLPSPYDPKLLRKLSISLLISSKDEFSGGQFQIMVSANRMETVNMNIGDVIIFPSDAMHRIKKIKSGKRVSLVGWFAGPPFK